MSRMIPSPDWFIGIDSFDLCVNGNWLDSITIEVSIMLSYSVSNTLNTISRPKSFKYKIYYLKKIYACLYNRCRLLVIEFG